MSSNVQIKGVLYQSKSAKKMTNAATPRGRDPSSGYSPSHNRSTQNIQNIQNLQNESSNKWGQNNSNVVLHHQQSLPLQNSQQQLALSTSTSFNQEYNQPQQPSQQQQNSFYQQQQQISARQHINQAQYINSIINRSRSPLNKSQSNPQQQGVSPISKSANKYNMGAIAQLITPSKTQRLATEQSASSTANSNNLTAQSASNPRYHATKSPRTINHHVNPNNLSATMSTGFGMNSTNTNNNNNNSTNQNSSISIYNMVLNDEIMNNKQFYQNPHTLRKANQQSHSYHNLQQYLQVNSNNSNTNLNNTNNTNNSSSINNNSSSHINNNNNSYSIINNNSNNNMLPPQQNLNNSSFLIQSQQNQEMRTSSSSNRMPYSAQGGDFSTKNNSQIPISMTSNSNRPDSNNNRSSNTLRMNAPVKQSSTGSNNINNNSIQKTNYTMYSNCTNCTELEKELELLRSIIKQCSKCQHSYLSNGSSNSHHNQNNAADSEKMAMLDPENNTLENTNFNGNNQYMMEKIQNMRLQEQIQQLMRQLEQVSIERDQLKFGHFNQSQEIIEKLQKYEAQIKLLQTNHSKTEQKLGNYNLLKNKLQDFINSCVTASSSSTGKTQLNTQELLQECLFIKDYISQQQNQINTLNQRQLVIAKPSLQNNSPLYNNNNNVGQTSNLGELVNQQLVLEERESLQNQYQALPSAIKALELVHRMKNIQQSNPFLPNQSQS